MKRQAFIYIAVFILCLLLYLLLHDGREKRPAEYIRYHNDTLRCAIQIESRLSSVEGRGVGFSYELLNYFAETLNTSAIMAYYKGDVWKNLQDGKLDIVVINTNQTTPPLEKYRLICSVPIKNNIVWVTSEENRALADNINFWIETFRNERIFNLMCNRYFRSYSTESLFKLESAPSNISPYDDIIKKYSNFVDLDWLLVASVAYQESHYYIGLQSSRDAKGIMQIKTSTAERYGITDLFDPDLNIKAGVLHLQYLVRTYRSEGLDSLNVVKFALAAYNAGEGNVMKFREAAQAKGYNPNNWDSVTSSLAMEETYTFSQTVRYVEEVMERYQNYQILLY